MRALALLASSFVLACQTGLEATGSTGDTGDDTAGTTTQGEQLPCGDAPHSMIVDGSCWCEPGTTWVDPYDPNAFECAAIMPREGDCDPDDGAGSKDACTCADYYTWCSPDPTNTACCYDPSQDPDGSHAPPSETTSIGDTSSGDASTTDATSTDATSTGETDASSSSGDTGSSSGDTSSTGDASTGTSSTTAG